MPAISVVMPVYNTPVSFLREAVGSILSQTFSDFEFIIVDDGSNGETRNYLESLTDPRIRLVHNETNIGITKSLNIGFRAARGKYIARMDGDDVCFPERFEKQVAFMESHPDVIVCGTRIVEYGKQPPAPANWIEDREKYRVRLLFHNPGPTHSTAFFDRDKLLKYRIEYDERLVYAQDYGMWASIIQYGNICNVPQVLLYYRKHESQISIVHRETQIRCDKMTQKRLLEQLLDHVTENELDLHYIHSTGYYRDAKISPQVAKWYHRLIRINQSRKVYDAKLLKRYIEKIKKNLIAQTIGKNKSFIKKSILYVRYLSVKTIAREIRDTVKFRHSI